MLCWTVQFEDSFVTVGADSIPEALDVLQADGHQLSCIMEISYGGELVVEGLNKDTKGE